MTTEEKAKRYDEVIKKAKSWYIDAQIDFKKSLENLFPELKVSEDEKIRQSLIHYLHGLGEFEYPDKETYNNWLAWLEKQGKIVDYYEDRLDECACKYFNKGYKHALEKQGEQTSLQTNERV